MVLLTTELDEGDSVFHHLTEEKTVADVFMLLLWKRDQIIN
jgi:hypothetical protein